MDWEHLFGAASVSPRSKGGVSLVFPDGLRYRISPSITNGKNQKVLWGWSTTRNEDGYFIGFREVTYANGKRGYRTDFRARKARWRVRHWALSQYNKSPYRDGPPYLPNRKGRL